MGLFRAEKEELRLSIRLEESVSKLELKQAGYSGYAAISQKNI